MVSQQDYTTGIESVLDARTQSEFYPKSKGKKQLLILGFRKQDIYNSGKYVFCIFWVRVYKTDSGRKCHK